MPNPPRRRWAPGSNLYVQRSTTNTRPPRPDLELPAPSLASGLTRSEQFEDFAVTFEDFDVSRIKPSDSPRRALARFEHQLPELIWNTAALEGNTFTLPEVRTLLDGVTVGGKPLAEQAQIPALRDAYTHVDQLVSEGRFGISKEISDGLHALLARHEALDAGRFRGEGQTNGGGGHVRLSNGGIADGADPGKRGAGLRARFTALQDGLAALPDPRVRALVYFASASRQQFYDDGNKRTARLMMAGELMSNGYDAVSIPFARRLEFNIALDTLFTDDNATPLLQFLGTCGIH